MYLNYKFKKEKKIYINTNRVMNIMLSLMSTDDLIITISLIKLRKGKRIITITEKAPKKDNIEKEEILDKAPHVEVSKRLGFYIGKRDCICISLKNKSKKECEVDIQI